MVYRTQPATGFPYYGKPAEPKPPVCGQVIESDEIVCPGCRMRWDRNEDRPPCPMAHKVKT